MFTLIFFSSVIYALILLILTSGIIFIQSRTDEKLKNFSIIVAARNEEKNIADLLEILINLNYPNKNYEIIVANDRSEDNTEKIISEFQNRCRNLKLVNIKEVNPQLVGKKGALDKAIRNSAFEHLVFTDADCLPTKNWLLEINKYWHPQVDFWAGYSPLILKNPFVFLLKNLERASIFAVTSGSFGLNWGITCTARNMGYRKSVFEGIQGFKGIGNIKSGDDDLLLQKMGKMIRKFTFLFSPDSIVWSNDKDQMKDQVNLETRRGSKWKYYSIPIKILSLFVFMYYIFFLITVIMWFSGNISIYSFLILLLMKLTPEFLILLVFLIKIRKLKFLLLFPVAQLIYIPYFIFFGLKGTLGKYSWK